MTHGREGARGGEIEHKEEKVLHEAAGDRRSIKQNSRFNSARTYPMRSFLSFTVN